MASVWVGMSPFGEAAPSSLRRMAGGDGTPPLPREERNLLRSNRRSHAGGDGTPPLPREDGRLGGTPRPTVGSGRCVAAKMASLHTAAQERGPPVRSRNGRDARYPSIFNGQDARCPSAECGCGYAIFRKGVWELTIATPT